MRVLALLAAALSASAFAGDGEPLLVPQQRHTSGVAAVAFSPDGRILASGAHNGTVKLWQAKSGHLLASLAEPHDRVLSLDFSPDGRWLVASRINAITQVWRVRNARTAHLFDRKGGGYGLAGLSSDGKLVVAGWDGACDIRELESGRLVRRFDGPEKDRFHAAVFTPDGKSIVAASEESRTYRWSRSTGALELAAGTPVLEQISFHPGGKALVSRRSRGPVEVRDGATLRSPRRIGPSGVEAYSFALSPDGDRIAVAFGDAPARIYAFDSGRELAKIGTSALSVAISPDGKRLATGGPRGAVSIFDVATGKLVRTYGGPVRKALCVGNHAEDGPRIAALSRERVVVWNLVDGKTIWTSPKEIGSARAAFNAGATHLGIAQRDRAAAVWDLGSGQPLPYAAKLPARIGAIAVGPAGKRLALRLAANEIAVFDQDAKKRAHTLSGDKYTDVYALGFSRDGRKLAQGGKGSMVQVLDVETGKRTARHYGPPGWMVSVAFSKDGSRVLTGGPYANLTLRDAALKERLRMRGHRGSVRSVAFAADETRLVSLGGENTVRLWNAADGRHLATLHLLPDDNWILLGANGVFDSSAGAGRHCTWTVPTDDGLASKPLDALSRRRTGLANKLLGKE